MSLTFTNRFTDVDLAYLAYKKFVEYKDELCIWDRGLNALDGRVLSSADGVAFATLYTADNAYIGNCNDDDGNGMAVYNQNLFINLYRSDTINPKVIEFDHITGAMTEHLPYPIAGGQPNYMGSNLLVWNRKLWVITGVTAPVADRRVVYYYDGSSWTAIVDYDGAAYLTYNKADGSEPVHHCKHRASRLFIFNGELYFVATRYDTTNAKWAWEVWKFDADDYDNFTKVYDSEAFDDDYILSGILTNSKDGKCYIIGNTISVGGNPQNPGKLYSSPDMETWTAETTIAALGFCYGEKFYDGRIYLNCLDTGTQRTQIKFIDDDLGGATQEQEIATNTSNRGGGMESFLGDLYIGKYKEIWGADAPTYKQTRTKARSCVGLEMTSRNKLGVETIRRYAPMDTRSPIRFYHGMLKSLSPIQRSIDDITGLFRIADMSAVIDNSTMEFSKILAGTEYFKDQLTKLYHFWADEPDRLREHIISLIVEDHSIKGVDFKVKFKDRALAYFEKEIPENIITEADFPVVYPDYKGDPMPEILGEASLTTGTNLGAVQALYTHSGIFVYLASAGVLNAVTEVYSDNVLKATPADYSIVVVAGRTFIDFTGDQGENIVSFNAQGYSFGAWNSVNGYIQNPAYIILYYLRYILGVPFSMLDVESFDNLADIYDNMGAGTSGKLILQQRYEAMEILRQLLFSYGAKGFMAKGGKFKVARKDISSYSTDTFIFDQHDALDQAENKQNLTKAENVTKDRYNYIPWLQLFKGSEESSRDTYPGQRERRVRTPIKDRRGGKR